MGWLAMPSLVAQAASPSIGSLLFEHLGADLTIAVLVGASVLNILIILPLLSVARRRQAVA